MSSEPSEGEAVAWNLDLNSSAAVHQAEPEGSGSLRKAARNSTAGRGFDGGGSQEKKNAGERDLREGNGEGLHLDAKSSAFSLDSGKEGEEALKLTTSIVDSKRNLEIKEDEPKPDEEQEQQVNRLGDESLVRKEEILNRDVSSHKVEVAPKSDPVGETIDSDELGQNFDEKQVQSGKDRVLNECKSAFSIGDMVWGKVRSHPWWPGQIFHPSFASEMALKHQKKDHFLVAYFGDKTFGWNDESRLKPFELPFPQMAKQSSLDAFVYAVNEALGEVARRMEIGMTCGYIADESVADLKYRKVENAGIKEGTCFPIGDQCLVVNSFKPDRLLKCIHKLAQSPCRDYDKLELIKLKAQFKAIYKSKGYPVLPEFSLVEGLVLENEEEITAPISGEAVKDNVGDKVEGILSDTSSAQKRRGRGRPPGKMKNVECILSNDTSSMQKRRGWGRPPSKKKHVEGDSQKQKSLPELMKDTDHSAFLNSNKFKPGVKAGLKSSCKKHRMDDSDSSDSRKTKKRRLNSLGDLKDMSASPSSTRAMIIGQCISQVVSEMKPPCPLFEFEDEKFHNGKTNANGRTSHVDTSSEIRIRDAALMQEYCSPSEMLSQLCTAATDPTNVYSFQTMIVSFFTDWKDSHVSDSFDDEKLANLLGSIKGRKKFAESDLTHVKIQSDYVQDSYWSDIIFQEGPKKEGSSDEVMKRKSKSDLKQQNKKTKAAGSASISSTLGLTSNTSEHVSDGSAISNDKQLQEERLVSLSGDKIVEECNPAALILNFSDPDALPSMSDLTRIFSQYGPLREAETDVSKKNRRASVVFERGADAEVAFSSAGKFSAFGPALVSYRLRYSTSSRTTPKKKKASPIEGGTADLPVQEDSEVEPAYEKD